MPKIKYRFDIAAMLLASVLTVIGISAADAARKGGGASGEFRSGSGVAASSGQHARPEQQTAPTGGFIRTGGKRGGIVERFGR